MKIKTTIVILLLIPAIGFAGIVGFLINTRVTTTVTGKLVYICTYNVAGHYQNVIETHFCDATMVFE